MVAGPAAFRLDRLGDRRRNNSYPLLAVELSPAFLEEKVEPDTVEDVVLRSSVSGSWRENPRKGMQVRRACADT